MHSTLRLRPHFAPERVINSRIKAFWPWLVASAAIHGLLLVFWLDLKLPVTASSAAEGVVIELVSIELQPGKQTIQTPTSMLPAQKKSMPDMAGRVTVNKAFNRQPLAALSDDTVPEPSTKTASMPMTRAEEEPSSMALTEQPTSSVQTIAAQQTPEHQLDAAEMDRVQMLVRKHLEVFKYYPASARRRSIEGHVEVGFTLTRDGAADQVSVLHGSGYAVLDHAALETVYRAQPFPIENGKYRFSLRFKRL